MVRFWSEPVSAKWNLFLSGGVNAVLYDPRVGRLNNSFSIAAVLYSVCSVRGYRYSVNLLQRTSSFKSL